MSAPDSESSVSKGPDYGGIAADRERDTMAPRTPKPQKSRPGRNREPSGPDVKPTPGGIRPAKPHISPVGPLKAWLDLPLEDRVMALVEDASLLELVRDLIDEVDVVNAQSDAWQTEAARLEEQLESLEPEGSYRRGHALGWQEAERHIEQLEAMEHDRDHWKTVALSAMTEVAAHAIASNPAKERS